MALHVSVYVCVCTRVQYLRGWETKSRIVVSGVVVKGETQEWSVEEARWGLHRGAPPPKPPLGLSALGRSQPKAAGGPNGEMLLNLSSAWK